MSRDRLKQIAVALAALILLWGLVEFFRGGFDEVDGDFAIPIVAQADADSVVFERAADTVVLSKRGEQWMVNGHRAAASGVGDFFNVLETAPHGQLVAQSIDTHGRLAIDDSTARVFRIFGNGETLAHMLVGKRASGFQDSYFRHPGEASVYSVRTRIATYVDRNVDDWRDRTIAQIDTSIVSSVEITLGSQGYQVRREGDAWQMPDGQAPDSAATVNLLREYASLSATGFRGPDDDPFDFDQPDRRVVLRDAAGSALLELALDSVASGFWVRKTGDSTVYQLTNFTVNRMTPTDSTLRRN